MYASLCARTTRPFIDGSFVSHVRRDPQHTNFARGYLMHPEIKSLGPDGRKCKPHTRGLLRRITVYGGLQHCIGKEVSRYEQGKSDLIESIDDDCIHYDGGRVA